MTCTIAYTSHVYSVVIRGMKHIDILLARHPHVTKKNNYLPGTTLQYIILYNTVHAPLLMLCVYSLFENTKQLTTQCFFTGNLVPNVIAEVYFVVQLLTARGIALALKPTQGTCTVGRHDWRVSVFNVAELSSRFITSKSHYR